MLVITDEKRENWSWNQRKTALEQFNNLTIYPVEVNSTLDSEELADFIVEDIRNEMNKTQVGEQVLVCLRLSLSIYVLLQLLVLGFEVWVPTYREETTKSGNMGVDIRRTFLKYEKLN